MKRIKRALPLIIAGFLFCMTPFTMAQSLSDIATSWYRSSIQILSHAGIVNGYADGTFQPKENINRAEFLKMVFTALEIPEAERPQVACFTDVPVGAWFAPAVCTAKERGIATGRKDGKFHPTDPVTVHEGLAFALRAFELAEPQSNIEPWYLPYEKISDQQEIIEAPAYTIDTLLTRGQAALLMNHTLEVKKDTASDAMNLSAGCGGAIVPMPKSLVIGGQERNFLLETPERYDPEQAYPLIVAFHGRTNSNEQVRQYMRFQRYDEEAFVVYPAALRASASSFSWGSNDDIEFFDTLVRSIADAYCIDRSQVFVAGHSLGAWMAEKVTCLRGNVVRGMAAIAGPAFWGNCSHPAASLLMHNPADPLVSYTSGRQALEERLEENTCGSEVVATEINGYSCDQYISCRTGNQVSWCDYGAALGGYPHSWPKNGTTAILAFFESLKE